MAWNGMGIDKDIMTSMEETQQLSFVEDLLHSKYSQSFKVLDVVDQLQRESGFVRQYIVPELQVLLKSLIEKIQILYGLLPYFPQVAGVVRVERWSSICDGTLSQIERTQKLIQNNLAAD